MKPPEEIKQLNTVSYLFQQSEITYDELEIRMLEILESYVKKRAVGFVMYFEEDEKSESKFAYKIEYDKFKSNRVK